MTRALVTVGTLLALCIGALVVVSVVFQDDESIAVDSILSENITRAVALRDEVDLRGLTDFRWDRVLVAEPDATKPEISRALGFEWEGQVNFTAGALLIFVDGARVARFADYRGEGRFAISGPVQELDRDQAVFTVDRLVATPRA